MKLVRVKIGEEIEGREGGQVIWNTDPVQYRHALVAKLQEECMEVCQELREKNIDALKDELGDVQEVVHAIMQAHGIDPDEVSAMRYRKWEKKGGFWDAAKGLCFYIKRGKKR